MSVPQVCVVYVMRPGRIGTEVLLGHKLTGLGTGKVVAPGGKLEPNELPVAAGLRELGEEVGILLEVDPLREVGMNRYRFPSKPSWDQDSYVFTARWVRGEPIASSELEPFWVNTADVPYERMWSDAVAWLPGVLNGQRCGGEYTFGPDLSTLQSIRRV